MGSFDKNKFKTIRNTWDTPVELFKKLDSEFHFQTDLACNEKNKLCKIGYTKKDNSLELCWKGICWLNPPYGKKQYFLKKWIEKAFYSSKKKNTTIVMLLPTRTNTEWWHNYCMKAKEVRFIRGRPKFGKSKHGLPLPLAIVIFGKSDKPTIYSSFSF